MAESESKSVGSEVGFFLAVIGLTIAGAGFYFLTLENSVEDSFGPLAGMALGFWVVGLGWGMSGEAQDGNNSVDELQAQLTKKDKELEKIRSGQDDKIKESIVEEVAESDKWYENKIEELGEEKAGLESQIITLKKQIDDIDQSGGSDAKALGEEIDELKQEVAAAKKSNIEQIAELEAKLEREQSKTSDLLDDRLSGLAIPAFTQLFDKRLDQITTEDLKGDNQTHMLSLYDKMKSVYSDNGLIDIDKLANAKGEIGRISQYEAIIDHFANLINRANKDESLDEEIREEKVNAYRRLMDREIAAMEGSA